MGLGGVAIAVPPYVIHPKTAVLGRAGGVKYCYYIRKFRKLGRQLGFSIGNKCFGYGLVIPHYGTIVVGGDVRCGNYCVLHTCVCITNEKGKTIGDALYASSGSKINKLIHLGNNVKICSNSVVNKSFACDNIVLGGCLLRSRKKNV